MDDDANHDQNHTTTSSIIQSIDVNAIDKDGMTALMWSAFKGFEDITKMLLDNGANIEATSPSGQTAISMALERNHHAVVHLLNHRDTLWYIRNVAGSLVSVLDYLFRLKIKVLTILLVLAATAFLSIPLFTNPMVPLLSQPITPLRHELREKLDSLNENVTHISLFDCQITDEDLVPLVQRLHSFVNLTSLDFSRNQVVDISSLSTLTNLTDLNIDGNQVVDIFVLPIR